MKQVVLVVLFVRLFVCKGWGGAGGFSICFGAACQVMDVHLSCAAFFLQQENKGRPFVIKPISSPLMKPLLVFVNPKSGGNQVSHC